MNKAIQGVVTHTDSDRRDDHLFRVSLKCFIRDSEGRVLVVKEGQRQYWDLPGGGMEHGESIHQAIARELHEEVNFESDFTFRVIAADEPILLQNTSIYQLRVIVEVAADVLPTKPGIEAQAILYEYPNVFEHSSNEVEQRIYRYSLLAAQASEL